LRRNFGLDNLRHSEEPEITRKYAWVPKKVDSGKVVWLSYYYYIKRYTNVEPKHKWIVEKTYTEWEYFISKLTN